MKSYQIAREGQTLGEFVESQIHEGLQTGYFLPTDWCWCDGMPEWQGLGVLFLPQAPPQPQMLRQPVPVRTVAVNPYAAPRSNVTPTKAPARRFVQQASLGARFGANFLDNIAIFACFIPFAFLSESDDASSEDMKYLAVGAGLVLLLVVLNCIFIISNGQTLGKKMVGIRTARMDDGGKAGFFQIVFLRFLVAQGLLGMIPLWGLIDILFIFGSEQRCLHDKIAGTQVLDA